MRKILSCILIIAGLSHAAIAGEKADTCQTCDGRGSTYWIKQLIDNGFRINDSAVCYPKFPRFALKVYNWGDRTFNSYDKNYVVGTGKNWKLEGKSYNWLETSTMLFDKASPISMHSDLYSDAGFSLSFMAVSIGYMWNVNSIFSEPTKRRTFNLDFTCSRFSINYQAVSSEGGMVITRFGDYRDGHHIHHHFSNCVLDSKTLDVYYFFNHNRYSQGAAYSYSKYQLRSSGTALVGFNLAEHNISMDFSGLPAEMLEYNPLETNYYRSHYRAYSLMGGYAYNWVLKPRRWTFNVTSMAAIGYKEFIDKREIKTTSESLTNTIRLNLAIIYNHRAFFSSFTARAYGVVNYGSNFSHLNSILTFTATAGMRF